MIELTSRYLSEQGFSQTLSQRFWNNVRKTNGCWIWMGGCSRSDPGIYYGSIYSGVNGRTVRAHVVSWILNRGPIPTGLFVCHNCPGGDNTLCVNPDHLWLGTSAQNMKDAAAKGRMQQGEERPHHKLTWVSVAEIRTNYRLGGINQPELALIYGVNQSVISRIISMKAWVPRKS